MLKLVVVNLYDLYGPLGSDDEMNIGTEFLYKFLKTLLS